jgi:hypothetical protein
VDQRDGAVKARKSNVHLKTILVEAANSASRTTGSYLKDKFFRLKSRRAHKRAAMAIGRKILQSAYLMLSTNPTTASFAMRTSTTSDADRTAFNLVRRIERLGFDVTITPKAQAQANSPQ